MNKKMTCELSSAVVAALFFVCMASAQSAVTATQTVAVAVQQSQDAAAKLRAQAALLQAQAAQLEAQARAAQAQAAQVPQAVQPQVAVQPQMAVQPQVVVQPQAVPVQTTVANPLAGLISMADAKRIALAEAGVAESDTRKMKVELDSEGALMVYEVEFHSGFHEYEYKIEARTGAVIGRKKELDMF